MSEKWNGESAEKKHLMNVDEINWSEFMANPIDYLREAFLEHTEDDAVADTPYGAEIILGQIELMLDGAEMYNIAVTNPDFSNYHKYGLTHEMGCAGYISICKQVGLSEKCVEDYLDGLYEEISEEKKPELMQMINVIYEGE